MITAEHLTKRFGAFTAIDDVCFHVGRGEIVGFLGPNGAGKSTTLRVLAGVFPPTHGLARIAGHDVVRAPRLARAAVGYFPERVALYLDMPVVRYLRYVARMKGLAPRASRHAAAAALADCDLEAVGERLIGTLSKGYRQRVGIAQALVGAPPVLILDEPTAGLDPEQVADMRALIRSLRGDRTVILSTHILPEVEATCDRVIIIHRGRIVAVDTPANLNRHLRRTARVYLEVSGPEGPVLRVLRALPRVTAVDVLPGSDVLRLVVTTEKDCDLREPLAAAVGRGGWGLRELRPLSLSLEEIFLFLVNEPDGGHAADRGASA